jgi:hypothetical protein
MASPRFFNRQIALPQDHGSWVFLFSPLIVGLAAGGQFCAASVYLVVAAVMAFLVRQPLTVMVKAASGRRPKSDLPVARAWAILYGTVAMFATFLLIGLRQGYIVYLAVPGAPVFAWHLWLVSRRSERRQAGVEIIATGVLSLVAPAAYWIGRGGYDPQGWWLWALTWTQSAASIVYTYLRLEQRDTLSAGESASGVGRRELWRMGCRAFLYTSFNVLATFLLGLVGILPWVSVAYLVQWLETCWGIEHTTAGWKPSRIGMRQLVISILWTVLFVSIWR